MTGLGMGGELRSEWSPRDAKLARATLLALRMTLTDPDEGGDVGYLLLPDRAPFELEDIVAALVSVVKPVTCVGIGIGGLLGVGCWPLPEDARRIRRENAHHISEHDAGIRRLIANDAGDANVLLIGYNENMVLSWTEYVEWQQQYFLYTLQSNLRRADAGTRAQGAQGSLEIYGIRKGGSGGGMTKGIAGPPDLA